MELYVSRDVEADGPIPGPHSMLSFGFAAYLTDKTLLWTFYANLDTLPGATGHPESIHGIHGKTPHQSCCQLPRELKRASH